jgi:hypothetical protein
MFSPGPAVQSILNKLEAQSKALQLVKDVIVSEKLLSDVSCAA